MSIHKLYNGQLKEFASKVTFNTANTELLINSQAYCLSDYFLTTVGFDDPTEAIEWLRSMLSESDAVYYVDANTIEQTKDQTGAYAHPFKTIYQAITMANKRRFVGSSRCYIRLLSDITLEKGQYGAGDKSTKLKVFHPDLIQSKSMIVEGWQGSGTSSGNVERRIKFDCMDNLDSDGNPIGYKSSIIIYCQTLFRHIRFDGSISHDLLAVNKYNCIHNEYNGKTILMQYGINTANAESTTFNDCRFENMLIAVVGDSINFNNAEFDYCYRAVNFNRSRLSVIYNNITIDHCYSGFYFENSSSLYWSYFNRPSKTSISTYGTSTGLAPIHIQDGSFLKLLLSWNNNGMWDGSGNLDENWSFYVWRISPEDGTTKTRVKVESNTSTAVKAWLEGVFSYYDGSGINRLQTRVGYTNGGYTMISYSTSDTGATAEEQIYKLTNDPIHGE